MYMTGALPYRTFSDYLKQRYGEKVYKLPVALPVTCPNRDGMLGTGGCTFCGSIGAGYENLPPDMTIHAQLEANKAHIVPKYKAKKFIPYFQNFSNTYTSPSRLHQWVRVAGRPADVVAVYIATRPDCIHDTYLSMLRGLSEELNIDICVELGLQSVNCHSLRKIHRGHTLGEFVDAVLRIKRFGMQSCAHLILNLPWDDRDDVIEDAKVLSALGVDQVKLHALYLVRGTEMARQFEAGAWTMVSREEYEERVITFLEYLSPDIVLQRLIGRAPEDHTIFSNWHTGWWKIRDHILQTMQETGRFQGRCCDYLNGRAVRKFLSEEGRSCSDA